MLGPHFYYDLIRIARKGRTTLLRCFYLIVLLGGVWVIYQVPTSGVVSRNDYARNAQNIGVTVVVLQYAMVLLVTPVYVCGAIIEEKKRRTLDLLFTTQLSDREIVLGKMVARFAHLCVVVLASLPLLVFVQLWGGIDMEFLVFHYAHALLILMLACALCIWASAETGNVVEALVMSYALFYGMGYPIGFFSFMPGVGGTAMVYGIVYAIMTPCYLAGTVLFAWMAIRRVRNMRLAWMALGRIAERRWLTRAIAERRLRRPRTVRLPDSERRLFQFDDDDESRPVYHRSRLNPLAWPIRGRALIWKELIKDGDHFSLTRRWLLPPIFIAAFFCLFYWTTRLSPVGPDALLALAYMAAFGPYFIALPIYAAWSLFRVTGSVVRERELHTLDYLLLLPVERFEILASKWLGGMLRPWPLLAIAGLGILFGFGCGLYGPLAAFLLVLLPLSPILMLSFFGLFLSVTCKRMMTANLYLTGALVALFIGHLLLFADFELLMKTYAGLAFDIRDMRFAEGEQLRGLLLVGLEQLGFLWLAGFFAAAAYYRFEYRRSEPQAIA